MQKIVHLHIPRIATWLYKDLTSLLAL